MTDIWLSHPQCNHQETTQTSYCQVNQDTWKHGFYLADSKPIKTHHTFETMLQIYSNHPWKYKTAYQDEGNTHFSLSKVQLIKKRLQHKRFFLMTNKHVVVKSIDRCGILVSVVELYDKLFSIAKFSLPTNQFFFWEDIRQINSINNIICFIDKSTLLVLVSFLLLGM